ncbi:MAG TPA: Spy/CpxP family protein refolding chaperone [Gemmatimonadaceae bacterium]|nr:Spy/CpxP family protein refolding chaperone [Gemmatimonadaceae bacterium]
MKLRSTLVALALVAGAGIAEAQSAPAQQTPRAERADSVRRDGKHQGHRFGARGVRGGAVLRGIQLTDAQRTRIRAIHDKYRAQYQPLRDQLRAPMDSARAARQRGDTTAARAALARTTPVRNQITALADRERAEIRGVLTAEQQKTFDANVQRMQERMTKQGEGKGHGRGRRNG